MDPARRHSRRNPPPAPPHREWEAGGDVARLVPDPFRAIVFPNRMREQRLRQGKLKLLPFSATLPEIPYIRLSKIERGTVVARADELLRIGHALGIPPADLLLDIDAPDFDMAEWFAPFAEGAIAEDEEGARFALILGAALRGLRQADARLTAPFVDGQYGIAPVILSRIENAQKPIERWSPPIVAALCRLFEMPDEAALRAHIMDQYSAGALAPWLAEMPGPEQRMAQTRRRIAALAIELDHAAAAPPLQGAMVSVVPGAKQPRTATATIEIFGAPMAGGLIAMVPTGGRMETPAPVGPRAFALRVCRATLGGGLPGQSTVIVDPDRYPHAGGLALVREGDGYRLLSIVSDRLGAMIGYSVNPACEIALDGVPPSDVAAVIGAMFV